MRRRNLAFAALFSIVLIAGVAWWGDQTHFRAFRRMPDVVPPEKPFVLPSDPPVVEVTDSTPKQVKEEVARPVIQDTPAKPTVTSFIQPIEPPQPVVDIKMEKIPTGGPGDSIVNEAFDPSQLDQPPVAIYQARPVYPQSMKSAGISGDVRVDFILDTTGKVRNAVAAHSSQREFEEAACDAVSKWKFKPGRKGGRAVYVHMQVPIVFTLSEE
jgi:protein TonB